MKTTIAFLPFLLLSFLAVPLSAQNASMDTNSIGGELSLGVNDAEHPCISAAEYASVEKRCADNIKALPPGDAGAEKELPIALTWPLKAAAGFNDCSFYMISAYVDQNTATGTFTDFNCGTRTYDGHRGTDIATIPFGFYKMDNSQVEVVAAAAGTIIDKADGNFDRNCATNSLTANYVILQHSDGSQTLYWHMKKNSVTTKAIGQSVAVGEYLGVVGSSGSSSGPHLHFEVWAGSTNATRVDPYFGPCNTLNNVTWWAAQKPYSEPAVVKASVHTTDFVAPGCPNTETPNESTCYALPFQGVGLPAGAAKFYAFLRNETAGMIANYSILNPDGTTFNSWTYTSTGTYNFGWRGWTKNLPTIPGTYTFQITYNGTTCSQTFAIINGVVTPSGSTTFCQGSSVMLSAGAATGYLWSNGATTQSITVSTAGTYMVTVTSSGGCTAVSPGTVVTVEPPPNATIAPSGPTTFCQGNSVLLMANTSSSYAWSNGATTQSITVSTAGSYTVTVTNTDGCTKASAATVITVNPLPIATIAPSGPTTFCQGNSVMLVANTSSSYVWSNGATTQSISVSTAGSYTVTVTNADGCTKASAATVITVNPLPTATIAPSGPTTFCQGNSVLLMANTSSSYAWSNGATTQSITVSNAGSYTVTVTNADGCTKASAATVVTVNPLPSTPAITANGTTLTSSSPFGNQWYWNGNLIPGAVSPTLIVNQNGTYTVTVMDANGCMVSSAAFHFMNTGTVSISEANRALLYPNPNTGKFTFDMTAVYEPTNNSTMEIFNLLGDCVYRSILHQRLTEIDITEQPSGLYQILLTSANRKQTFRMLKL